MVEEYGDDDTPVLVIHKDSETRVCFMATPGSHGDPAKIEADAHLIAAAPDLLAALKAMVNAVGNHPVTSVDEAERIALAVIAKAEGC
jgi:hypothetical protein